MSSRITIPASQMSRLAMQVGGGDNTYDQSFNQQLMSQSSIGKAIEEANLKRQQALEIQDQRAARHPDAVRRNAMIGFGIPVDADEDVSTVLNTGRLPDKYSPLPQDQAGPVLAKPEWTNKLGGLARQIMTMNNALTLGDKNVENVAKAYGTYDNLNKQDRVIDGSLPASRLGEAVAASKGSKLVDNIGDTGEGYNLFSGEGTTLNSGLRGVFNKKASALINKENSQAGASNASAAHSYASRDKVRQDIEMGSKGVLADTDQGKVLVDPRSGIAVPVRDKNGNVLASNKPLNSEQANALTFASRMQASHDILGDLSNKGVYRGSLIKQGAESVPMIGGALGMAANKLASPDQQKVEQAQRDFINAVLRRESGAAISMGEFSNAEKQYFPQPNDSKEVIKQKDEARQRVINGMLEAVPASHRASAKKPASKMISVDY